MWTFGNTENLYEYIYSDMVCQKYGIFPHFQVLAKKIYLVMFEHITLGMMKNELPFLKII